MPQPFAGVDLGAIRRLIKQHDIVWHDQIIRTVKTGVIGLDDVKIVRVALRKVVEKPLKVVGVHSIMLLQMEFAGQRFHRTVKIKRFEPPLNLDSRFDFLQRDASARDRFQAEPAFVLRPITDFGIPC